MNTIVIAYDQRDVRGPIRTRLKALWLFVVGMFLAVLTLPLLVLGRGVLVGMLPDKWQSTATVLVNAVFYGFYVAVEHRRVGLQTCGVHLCGKLKPSVCVALVRAYHGACRLSENLCAAARTRIHSGFN